MRKEVISTVRLTLIIIVKISEIFSVHYHNYNKDTYIHVQLVILQLHLYLYRDNLSCIELYIVPIILSQHIDFLRGDCLKLSSDKLYTRQ